MLLGFETLDLKIRRLKLWKPTVYPPFGFQVSSPPSLKGFGVWFKPPPSETRNPKGFRVWFKPHRRIPRRGAALGAASAPSRTRGRSSNNNTIMLWVIVIYIYIYTHICMYYVIITLHNIYIYSITVLLIHIIWIYVFVYGNHDTMDITNTDTSI